MSLFSLFRPEAGAIFEFTETPSLALLESFGAIYSVIKLFLVQSLYFKIFSKSDFEVNFADFGNLHFAIQILYRRTYLKTYKNGVAT